jgi:hypothetical protein
MLHFADRPDAVFTALITRALLSWASRLQRYPTAATLPRACNELDALALRRSAPLRRMCRNVNLARLSRSLLGLHTDPTGIFAPGDACWMLLDHALRHFALCHRVRVEWTRPQLIGPFRVGPIHTSVLFAQYFAGRGFTGLEEAGTPGRPLPPLFAQSLTGAPVTWRDFSAVPIETPGWSHPLETPVSRSGLLLVFPPGPEVRHALANGLPVVTPPAALPIVNPGAH